MQIKTLSKNLNFKNIPFVTLNKGNNDSKVSKILKCSTLIICESNLIKQVIISADIIWFTETIVEEIRKKINTLYKISEENIVFCASHTHGSPNPHTKINYGKNKKRIEEYLLNRIFKIFIKTYNLDAITVLPFYSSVLCQDVSINRRKKAIQFKSFPFYQMQSLPNQKGKNDIEINIINLINKHSKESECVIIKHTCHPVSNPDNIIGADYPGYIRTNLVPKISKNFIFMQGFCGDIRPKIINKDSAIKDKVINILVGNRFRKAQHQDSKYIASSISKKIIQSLSHNKFQQLNGTIKSSINIIDLPLEDISISPRKLESVIWIWGHICFIYLNAEVLSGFMFKDINNLRIINVGYSNGMIGYLPTKQDILDGGYEVDKSRNAFGLKSRVSLTAEMKIKSSVINQIKKLYLKY